MKRIRTDICVIGAGSGGLSVAAGAVQMGARVVLVEGHKMGGDCLNYGCVPSKALLAAAKAAHAQTNGAVFGVAPVTPQVDYSAVREHVARTIAGIAPHDSVERFEGLGVQVIQDWGRFISPRELQAGDTVIAARRFVIATGSRAFIPPIPGLADVAHETNETIFSLPEKPGHLLVIGGGPIGMEMAQAHRRLGCEVTVIEAQRALGQDDPEAAALVVTALQREGVRVIEGCGVAAAGGQSGAIELRLADGRLVQGTHLLVAVGRRPNLERLDLDRAGVVHDSSGIRVNTGLRSSNRRIHAIGDVAGKGQFTHLAGYHAGVVIRSMLFGLPAKARHDHIPHVTYTDPELAQIGLTEAAARDRHGDALSVLRWEYGENDRARAEARTEGFIKVMAVKGRPVGVTIVGAQAGELVSLWALVMARGLKLGAVAGTVLPYPTLAEIGKRAAGAYFSPKLFDNPMVKRVVGLVQRVLP